VDSNVIRTAIIWIVGALFVFAVYSQTFYRRPPPPLAHSLRIRTSRRHHAHHAHAKNLACASAKSSKGYHCDFQSRASAGPNAKPRPPPLLDVLAPTKRRTIYLFLVPGLFQQDALRERLLIDPAASSAEHIRFVANCKMHIDGKLKQVDVRWATSGPGKRNMTSGCSVTGCWPLRRLATFKASAAQRPSLRQPLLSAPSRRQRCRRLAGGRWSAARYPEATPWRARRAQEMQMEHRLPRSAPLLATTRYPELAIDNSRAAR